MHPCLVWPLSSQLLIKRAIKRPKRKPPFPMHRSGGENRLFADRPRPDLCPTENLPVGRRTILVHLQRGSRNHGIERQVLQADHRRRHLPFLLPPSIEKRASPTPLSRRDIRTYEKTKSRSHAGHNRQPYRPIS